VVVMTIDQKKLEKKLQISKFRLLNDFPFFGILALYFKYELTEGLGTAGTDGKNILFDPQFLDKLSIPELNWVLAHEIMHVSNGHIRRRGTRRHDLFNYASDYAVHCILKDFESRDFKMPKEGLYDSKYNGWSAEQIYDDLYQQFGKSMEASEQKMKEMAEQMIGNHDAWGKGNREEDKNKDNEGSGSGSSGNGDESSEGSSKGKDNSDNGEVSEEEWKQRMLNAAKVAATKSCGKNSAFLNKLLSQLKPPQKDWRTLLQEFIIPEINDYSFNPPDKRFNYGSDCLLPDFNDEDETVKNIIFYIDISGSMSDKDISEVYSEVVGAVNQFSSMSGYLGYFDTSIHSFKKFEDVSDILENRPYSGGGTHFRVCFEHIHKLDEDCELQKEDIAGIVLLTDGYCEYDGCEKLAENIPTLWIMTESNVNPAPFGQTVYLRDKKDNSLNI